MPTETSSKQTSCVNFISITILLISSLQEALSPTNLNNSHFEHIHSQWIPSLPNHSIVCYKLSQVWKRDGDGRIPTKSLYRQLLSLGPDDLDTVPFLWKAAILPQLAYYGVLIRTTNKQSSTSDTAGDKFYSYSNYNSNTSTAAIFITWITWLSHNFRCWLNTSSTRSWSVRTCLARSSSGE